MKYKTFRQFHKRNKGTTMVEMVVSFMLLSIFVSSAAVIIFNVTNLYYHVRSESYARQVADIVVNKVSTEITGAYYDEILTSYNPKIYEKDMAGNDVDGSAIELRDRTNTLVRIYAKDGILQVYYLPIVNQEDTSKSRVATIWNYDKSVYNGYTITELDFAQANSTRNASLASHYQVSDVNINEYDGNVIAVYMKLESGKYGDFTVCRFFRIYNAPKNAEIEYVSH